ncbi:MAG: malate synthase A, partial [Halobacteriovoraceae bacterium]|nr:malate synthase A [Halobacteriovoraceae bacterium]
CGTSTQLSELLSNEQFQFIEYLHNKYDENRIELLKNRENRQRNYDNGASPEYDKNSEACTSKWKVAPIPNDLKVRRVEITGPINDPKMVINMLNRNGSGFRADTAMLDFEDSMKPSWSNVVSGLQNILGVSQGVLKFEKKSPDGNVEKTYSLNADDSAKAMVRVRGLHLNENNIKLNGQPISGGMFDLVATSLISAHNFIKRGQTPKFYVPKCEHFEEARWWNQIFSEVEDYLKIPRSSIRATFLIETLPAAFQIEEILFELREHAAGLNVGRWDKIFSDIKVLGKHKDKISADRASINMAKFWMDNYAKRLIKICHERGAYAIGGMSAFTPGKDEETRDAQTKKVSDDKKNEFRIGHDGCWVSHPYFIGPAMEAFPKDNQIEELLPEFERFPNLVMDGEGPRTIQGLRTNLRVGIAYMQGWNRDLGCVAWDNLMEDLATLEISRAQTWQWLYHNVSLDTGETVDENLITITFDEEFDKITSELNLDENSLTYKEFKKAKEDACTLFLQKEMPAFLTTESELG